MKATSIQIGKSYEAAVGRGVTIVKVIDINRKSGAWICEAQTGKDITVKGDLLIGRKSGGMKFRGGLLD